MPVFTLCSILIFNNYRRLAHDVCFIRLLRYGTSGGTALSILISLFSFARSHIVKLAMMAEYLSKNLKKIPIERRKNDLATSTILTIKRHLLSPHKNDRQSAKAVL